MRVPPQHPPIIRSFNPRSQRQSVQASDSLVSWCTTIGALGRPALCVIVVRT